MPDKDGKLTDEDRKKVNDWLAKFPEWINGTCPICGSKQWMLAEHLVQPVTLGPSEGLQLGGIGYPQIMLVSNPCGYTRMLNAVIIGVLQETKKAE